MVVTWAIVPTSAGKADGFQTVPLFWVKSEKNVEIYGLGLWHESPLSVAKIGLVRIESETSFTVVVMSEMANGFHKPAAVENNGWTDPTENPFRFAGLNDRLPHFGFFPGRYHRPFTIHRLNGWMVLVQTFEPTKAEEKLISALEEAERDFDISVEARFFGSAACTEWANSSGKAIFTEEWQKEVSSFCD